MVSHRIVDQWRDRHNEPFVPETLVRVKLKIGSLYGALDGLAAGRLGTALGGAR